MAQDSDRGAQVTEIDHAKLRDAALDEAAKADGRMKQMAEGTGKKNMYLTYTYLLWLAERHEEAIIKQTDVSQEREKVRCA